MSFEAFSINLRGENMIYRGDISEKELMDDFNEYNKKNNIYSNCIRIIENISNIIKDDEKSKTNKNFILLSSLCYINPFIKYNNNRLDDIKTCDELFRYISKYNKNTYEKFITNIILNLTNEKNIKELNINDKYLVYYRNFIKERSLILSNMYIPITKYTLEDIEKISNINYDSNTNYEKKLQNKIYQCIHNHKIQ